MSDDPETQPADREEPPTPEEFEEDPARNPAEDELNDIKGG